MKARHILPVTTAIVVLLGAQGAAIYGYYKVHVAAHYAKKAKASNSDEDDAREACCVGGCDLKNVVDRYCYDKDEDCPVFPLNGTEPCRQRKQCNLRLKALPLEATPFSMVLSCLEVVSRVTNTSKTLRTHPAPKTNWELTNADLPIIVAKTGHFCWRPCTKDWPCQGKNGGGKKRFARDPCWKNFYRPGKHYRIRRHKSLMAVWGPPVQDQISSLISKKWGYDPKLQACVRRFLDHPKGMVYDVGSNLGVVSLLSVHMGHRVVAFDPTPWTRHKLLISSWLNNMTESLTVIPTAVGNHTGTARLINVPGNLGGNQISLADGTAGTQSIGPGSKGSVLANITTLDEMFYNGRLPPDPPFFVKIDVEGHEIQVVQGARRLLKEHRPGLIIETCDWCSPAELFSILQSLGYVCGRDTPLIERTASALPGQWKWDVLPVLYPQKRHQLRPNVACIYDPPAAQLPFDTSDPATRGLKKQWKSYSVE